MQFAIQLPSNDREINLAFLQNELDVIDRALGRMERDTGLSDAFAFTDPDKKQPDYAAAALAPLLYYAMVRFDHDGHVGLAKILPIIEEEKRYDFSPEKIASLRAHGFEKIGVVANHFSDILGSCAKITSEQADEKMREWIASSPQTNAAAKQNFIDIITEKRTLYAKAMDYVRAMPDTPPPNLPPKHGGPA